MSRSTPRSSAFRTFFLARSLANSEARRVGFLGPRFRFLDVVGGGTNSLRIDSTSAKSGSWASSNSSIIFAALRRREVRLVAAFRLDIRICEK